MQLLDEDEITGDDEFQSVLFGKEPKPSRAEPEPKPKEESNPPTTSRQTRPSM